MVDGIRKTCAVGSREQLKVVSLLLASLYVYRPELRREPSASRIKFVQHESFHFAPRRGAHSKLASAPG
jgi:hypothetical protein